MPNQEPKKSYKFFAPKVFIRTFGCQMNVRDSEVIRGLLTTNNYQLTTNPDDADIVIFNTCSVRQHAEDKVWSEIGRYKQGQSPKNNTVDDISGTVPLIGIVGCMAQNYKGEIFRRAPQVDFVVGPSDIHKIPDILSRFLERQGQSPTTAGSPERSRGKSGDSPCLLYETKIWETDGSIRPEEIYHTGFYEDKEHAYVVISEGCSNFCSYCVVPYVRGELKNRDYENILREIEETVDKGITKITLLGQNVCAYGAENREQGTGNKGGVNFIRLLEMVERIKGLKEFSFITSHPRDTTVDLFKVMAECNKLKKYLHLPIQSGSDRVLKLMNRGYIRKFYLDLVENYRKMVKNGALTTDIIVGFPSESEEDFLETYNLVKEIRFDAAYIFKYSPRPNTEALKYADDVTRQNKERRHKIILDLQREISKNNVNLKS